MKKILFMFIIVVILIFLVCIPSEKKDLNKIKIGVSDDISGLVVDYMIKDKELGLEGYMEAYFIKDC